jgi:hypothetical protein
MFNRAADNWRPLLAIADLAGDEWPQKARKTAEALAGAVAAQSVGVRLLSGVRDCFGAKGVDHISTEDIVKYLLGLDDQSWSEERPGGKPITKAWVSRKLSDFGVQSDTIWFSDGRSRKGYRLAGLTDAFQRYLDASPGHARSVTPSQNVKPSEPATDRHSSHVQNVRQQGHLTFRKITKPNDSRQSDALTVSVARHSTAHGGPQETDEEEQAAIIEHDGKIPREWADVLARLDPDRPPPDVSPRQWLQYVQDCGRLGDWAHRATSLELRPRDLFGWDGVKPFPRTARTALAWRLEGWTIVRLYRDIAVCQAAVHGAERIFRRLPGQGVWVLDAAARHGLADW